MPAVDANHVAAEGDVPVHRSDRVLIGDVDLLEAGVGEPRVGVRLGVGGERAARGSVDGRVKPCPLGRVDDRAVGDVGLQVHLEDDVVLARHRRRHGAALDRSAALTGAAPARLTATVGARAGAAATRRRAVITAGEQQGNGGAQEPSEASNFHQVISLLWSEGRTKRTPAAQAHLGPERARWVGR